MRNPTVPCPRWMPTACLAAAVLAAAGGAAGGQPVWYESFEGPQPTWEELGGDLPYRIERQQRVRDEAKTGEGSEHLRVAGSVHLGHAVGRPRVIEELLLTVWVKADGPHVQSYARVVFPRTADRRGNGPLTTLVPGSGYTSPGHWEQLRVADIPEQLARQVRALRLEHGSELDPREAYVDRIVLAVQGHPEAIDLWIDDLDVAGHVEAPEGLAAPPPPQIERSWGTTRSAAESSSADGAPRLSGSVLVADEMPFFLRAIRYRGESLATLSRLGFNAVWLDRLPDAEILAEAQRLQIWIIAPPPLPVAPPDAPGAAADRGIDARFDRVLAWDLGRHLAHPDVQPTRAWAERIRAADPLGRPLVCSPETELRAYSRAADVLLHERPVLGTSQELTDYRTWLGTRARLARPGTPFWTAVATEPAAAVMRQWRAAGARGPQPRLQAEQIRLAVFTALAAGSRGILFDSDASLEADDAATAARAAALELINQELETLRPWLAAGSFLRTVRSSDPQIEGAVFSTRRAWLLVPLWTAPGSQCVPGQIAATRVSFVVPGVPEDYNAFELTPGGLRPLMKQRVVGGRSVTLEEYSFFATVLLTQEPQALAALTRRMTETGRRSTELKRALVTSKGRVIEAGRAPPDRVAASRLEMARENLAQADRLFASGDYGSASRKLERAMRPLRLIQREAWEAAVEPLGSPVVLPSGTLYGTLPWHRDTLARLAAAHSGPNRLPGGDFEDPAASWETGWRHYQRVQPGIQGEAALVPEAARNGRYGLRLSAHRIEAEMTAPPGETAPVESPPVWITTPPVAVEAGEMIRIRAALRVPEPIEGSVDGVLVLDSLGGESLAARVGAAPGWQDFVLFRLAPTSGTMTVTFALSGIGEVWLDDVAIEPLHPPATGNYTYQPSRSAYGAAAAPPISGAAF